MTEVLFYHLERSRLEDVLPGLLEKTLERNWRAVVRASSRERVKALDDFLWTYRDESFLPHGAGVEGDKEPIWLTEGDGAPNEPNIIFLVDGAKAEPLSIAGLERCVMIFDGRDDEAVGEARGFWKAVKAEGHEATYWKQSPQTNRFEKQE
ncbi:MAG: DNA polymerase III subunit chi [Marinicaulis sp.]|nr:DNA polymerase III subunit chi [Marinicaulis sp.]